MPRLMRVLTAAATLAGALALSTAANASALPSAACNQGTANAHSRVPETNGAGTMPPGHLHIPGGMEHPCTP